MHRMICWVFLLTRRIGSLSDLGKQTAEEGWVSGTWWSHNGGGHWEWNLLPLQVSHVLPPPTTLMPHGKLAPVSDEGSAPRMCCFGRIDIQGLCSMLASMPEDPVLILWQRNMATLCFSSIRTVSLSQVSQSIPKVKYFQNHSKLNLNVLMWTYNYRMPRIALF